MFVGPTVIIVLLLPQGTLIPQCPFKHQRQEDQTPMSPLAGLAENGTFMVFKSFDQTYLQYDQSHA